MDTTGTASASTLMVKTYHCLCTTLILTSLYSLSELPTRADPALDHAIILPLSQDTDSAILQNVRHDARPIVVRREDGLEKRTLLTCNRCQLAVGYKLDEAQFANADGSGNLERHDEAEKRQRGRDLVYLLPGGLTSTEEMVEERSQISSASNP